MNNQDLEKKAGDSLRDKFLNEIAKRFIVEKPQIIDAITCLSAASKFTNMAIEFAKWYAEQDKCIRNGVGGAGGRVRTDYTTGSGAAFKTEQDRLDFFDNLSGRNHIK